MYTTSKQQQKRCSFINNIYVNISSFLQQYSNIRKYYRCNEKTFFLICNREYLIQVQSISTNLRKLVN